MSYESFTLEKDGHVANMILCRGESFNTMTKKFWIELPEILNEINRDPDLRAVVMSSTGKHFCAGMDLANFNNGVENISPEKKPDHARVGEVMYRVAKELQGYITNIETIRAPVIAAIQGGCIGGALDMVTACDIRLCTKDAFFCIQEINIGMAADVGTLQRLPRLIPEGKVRDLAYTGRRMMAEEAKECGLVNEVYDSHEAMLEAADAMAKEIASKSPVAIYGLKEVLNYSRDHTVKDGLEYNALWSGAMLSSKDMGEAMQAKMEKRETSFDKMVAVKKYDETGS